MNSTTIKRMKGVTLLDVLLAIVIFVIGMLALAHLQTNLTKSSTDANTRTVAANVAEELLERARNFRRVSTDPDGVVLAFADIDAAYFSDTVPRGGLDYTVTADVKGYDFNADMTVAEADPAVAGTVYDFKVIELTVTWDANASFMIDEDAQATAADMGTGSIVIREILPSVPPLAAAKVAAENDGAPGTPPVNYDPGFAPEILRLTLGDSGNQKFKESTTPKPDVIRRDEFVETWFDVVTYSGTSNAIFLRREEFLVVSCACTMKTPGNGGDGTGFLPTYWNGESYTEGEWVSKPYGVSASNQQSPFCDTCCRDHHDSASYTGNDYQYDPFKDSIQNGWTASSSSGNLSGDHAHFGRSNQGVLSEIAGNNDDYVEVCRMVRKDGFMRVAQDFRQEGFIAVPESWFTDTANVTAYSNYVTGSVLEYYNSNATNKTLTEPHLFSPMLDLPGDASTHTPEVPNMVPLPTATGATDEQLSARGIYIDHISSEAATVLNCITSGGTGAECAHLNAQSVLEYVPFFEVQLTWLSYWSENSSGDPVSVTNEQVSDDNNHSRGLAAQEGTTAQMVTVTPEIHRGNTGIAATAEINDLHYSRGMADYDLLIDANLSDGTGGDVTGAEFSGVIGSYSNSVSPSDVTFTGGGGANCNLVGTNFTCTIADGSTSPTLTISGYWKNSNTDLWVCESTNTYIGYNIVQTSPKSTTFDLPATGSDVTGLQFTISDTACPTG